MISQSINNHNETILLRRMADGDEKAFTILLSPDYVRQAIGAALGHIKDKLVRAGKLLIGKIYLLLLLGDLRHTVS